jgi:pimeloyl-ACP methyl ester carboxylesterase
LAADLERIRFTSPDGLVSGWLTGGATGKPLLACIHGGGCNAHYFDLKGASLIAAAKQRGFPVLAINRPGYGGNVLPGGSSPIRETAPAIRRFIDRVRRQLGDPELSIIGHSIGGAIAMHLASRRDAWPLRAVAISGIGDVSPDTIRSLELPADARVFQPPPGFTEALFHDPERNLHWKPLASLRAAAEPWLVSEVVEVVRHWPVEWPGIAAKVDVPVHLRLAEHERIWETGEEVVARMAAALCNAPRVDAALLHGGGHLFEAYRGGPELIRGQLDFVESA